MTPTIPPELERAVLTMIRNGGGKASWHRLATWLPSFDVPLVPDLMVVLKDLKARGLAKQTMVGGGMDRWELTPLGDALLDMPAEPAPPLAPAPGPLSPTELQSFAAGVRGDLSATMSAIEPLVDDRLKFWAVLRQLLAADPAEAARVAELALFLPPGDRAAFARELLDDRRPEVRAALFQAWTPVQPDIPGDPLPTVSDDDLDELLRRGLTDPAPSVREAAAAVAFVAVRGGALIGELTINLGAPERGLRWWSILALGGASDPITRELLIETAQGEDLAQAAAAIRALGQRADGHAAWLAGLQDPRADVHNAAVFALQTVVRGLSDDELVAVARDPRPNVQAALAAYRARANRS